MIAPPPIILDYTDLQLIAASCPDRLIKIIQERDAEIADLRKCIMGPQRLHLFLAGKYGLEPRSAAVLASVCRTGMVVKQALCGALDISKQNLSVIVCKLRKKLPPGALITVYGEALVMTPDMCAQILEGYE